MSRLKELLTVGRRIHYKFALLETIKRAPHSTTLKEMLDLATEEDALAFAAMLSITIGDLRATTIQDPNDDMGGACRKRGVTSNRIVEYVGSNPGCDRGDIMRALNLKGGTASSQLRKLRVTGRLISEGAERDMKYYVA